VFLHVVENVLNNLILDVIIVIIQDVKENVVEHVIHATIETVVVNVAMFLHPIIYHVMFPHLAMFPTFNSRPVTFKAVVDTETVTFPIVTNVQDRGATCVTRVLVFA